MENLKGTENIPTGVKGIFLILDQIDIHNRQHGSSALMGKQLAHAITSSVGLGDSDKSPQLDHQNEAHLAITQLRSVLVNDLSDWGLNITARLNNDEDQVLAGDVSLAVSDVQRFIKRIQISDQELSKLGLDKRTQLKNQIITLIENTTTDVDLKELTATLTNCNFLGEWSSTFKNYHHIAEAGELSTYTDIRKRGLFNNPGEGFGPADWVRDSTPPSLKEMWGKAIASLNDAEVRGATVTAQLLRDHLLMCAAHSHELVGNLEYWKNREGAVDEFRAVIVSVTQQLVGQVTRQ
jgi:hypothetical protein